jgi:hypothetical protein
MDCAFEVLTLAPQEKFKEIGIITFDDVMSSSRTVSGVSLTVAQIKEEAGYNVCPNGGNALILSQPTSPGKYSQGTVVFIERPAP